MIISVRLWNNPRHADNADQGWVGEKTCYALQTEATLRKWALNQQRSLLLLLLFVLFLSFSFSLSSAPNYKFDAAAGGSRRCLQRTLKYISERIKICSSAAHVALLLPLGSSLPLARGMSVCLCVCGCVCTVWDRKCAAWNLFWFNFVRRPF